VTREKGYWSDRLALRVRFRAGIAHGVDLVPQTRSPKAPGLCEFDFTRVRITRARSAAMNARKLPSDWILFWFMPVGLVVLATCFGWLFF
jgi:hypothetical protein